MSRTSMFVNLTSANVKEMVRDKAGLFWFLAFPVLFVFLYGFIFSSDMGSISFDIATVAPKANNISFLLNQSISSVPAFSLHTGQKSIEMDELKKGNRDAVIVVPKDARTKWEAGETVTLPVYYDNTQTSTGQVVLSSVSQLIEGVEQRLTGQEKRFIIQPRPVNPEKTKQIDFLLPGILGMAIMQAGLFGSMRIVGLRQQKVLKGLGATPLPRGLFLVSEVFVRLCLVLVQTAIIVGVGVAVFDVSVVGNPLVVLGTVMMGATAFISLGYLLTSFMKTVDGGQGLIQAIQMPMLFLSGIFFPSEFLPKAIVPIMKAMPLTYLGDALRQTMVGLPGENAIGLDFGILAIWIVVTAVCAARLWKWE